MKHKYKLLPIALIVGFIFPAFGYAVEVGVQTSASVSSTSTRRDEVKRPDEKKEIQSNFKSEVKQLKASTTELRNDRKEEFKSELAKKQAINVSRILTATANRLDKLVSRIESRIQKLKSAGGSTASAEASVVLAKANIVSARVHIATINTLNLNSGSTTASEVHNKIKLEAKAAKGDLQKAHQNLAKAVSSLKGIEKTVKVKGEVNSTTTATTTATTTSQ